MAYNGTNGPVAAFNYTLDVSGNRVTMTDNEGVTNYTYDNLNRLTRAEYPDSTWEAFSMNIGGNRVRHQTNLGTTDYNYGAGSRLLSTTGKDVATYSWDNNGNMTAKTTTEGATTYTWNSQNKQTQVILPDGGTNQYSYYPGSDLRYSTMDADLNVERFFYDGSNVIEELNELNYTTARYIEGAGIDSHIARVTDEGVFAYVTDPLGTVRNVVDSTGVAVNSYDYKAYGDVRNKTEVIPNPYLYTGRRWNDETKEYYYRARYYQPGIGRFSAVDRLAPGEASYGYVNGNPVMFGDPLGLVGASWASPDEAWATASLMWMDNGNGNEFETSPEQAAEAEQGCCGISQLLSFDCENRQSKCDAFKKAVKAQLKMARDTYAYRFDRDVTDDPYSDVVGGAIYFDADKGVYEKVVIKLDITTKDSQLPFKEGNLEERLGFCRALVHENTHAREFPELYANVGKSPFMFKFVYGIWMKLIHGTNNKSLEFWEKTAYQREIDWAEELLEQADAICGKCE
jgi:RHS repeat-associated protein